MTTEQQPRTFADHVAAYAQAGWPCVLPVPAEDKFPPPVGFTGTEGRDTDPLQLVEWAGSCAGHSIALRMPDGVIGIDVDQYEKKGTQKRGAETLASCIERWGPLPATWSSTARGSKEGPGESRIMLFRVPARRYATKLTGTAADGTPTADVEIIQRHHRYAVVWPSPHHDAGDIYRWYAPDGRVSERPPSPADLAELPKAWVEGLAEGATDAGPASADHASGQALLDHLLEDHRPECADITNARLVAMDEMATADPGSRHDTMTARVHQLVQLAARGHQGFAGVVLQLRELWEQLTAGEDRGEEFDRMLLTSARKAVTLVGTVQVPTDPCLVTAGFAVAAPMPGDERPESPENPPLEGVEPGRWYSVREAVGIHAFDPRAGLDQALAEAVLERMYPALRYAYDSGSWLIRVPERWEERRDLAGWAVAQLAPLMPAGNPTAEKGTEQHTRASNRARLMGTPGAKAVAAKMDALVKGGTHPASVRLGALDSDPEILWAGGMPYSLRHSAEGPTFAQIDPATPHLHAAGVMPETRPTPLWDAFLEAVWPDPEVRRWALRVLAIALTGYADRALPILLGETGRGKTQVVHLLMSVLGSYAHAANPKLLNSGSNEHDTIVYALKGRRLSFIDEAPSDRKAGQERLKQLTGGGELTARQMNRDPITFGPTHTLVLTANDEPVLTDPAVRSRARLIPCEGDPDQVRDARAAIGHVRGSAWREEAPGVLAKMMSEAASWLADTSSALQSAAPEGIRYSAEIIAAEQDPITRWLEDETEPYEPGTPSRELYQAFVASCRQANIGRDVTPSETKWGRELTRRGYPSQHGRRGKVRQLRIRQNGGFWPAESTPDDELQQNDRGSVTGCDGLVTGSNPNPSREFPQVNPSVSVGRDWCDGFKTPLYTCAPAPAQGSEPEKPSNPSQPVTPESEQGALIPAPKPTKAKRQQTEEARRKRAAKAEEKRAAAIAEAAGEHYDLPATVTPAGAIASCTTEQAAALLRGTRELTIDVEHTGYPVGHRHYALRTVQLGRESFAVVLDPTDSDQADLIRRTVAEAEILHAHSATADLVPMEVAGLLSGGYEEAWSRMHDTVNLAKLTDPTSTGSDPELKKLAKSVLGDQATSPDAEAAKDALFKAGKWLKKTQVTTPIERSGWAQVDPGCETMIRYAASDVLDDAALAKRLPQPDPVVLERERMVQRVTARVALHGLALDGDQVGELRGQQQAALADAAERLSHFGIENPGSDQQVAAAVEDLGLELPRTRTGRPSVASGVLEPHKGADGPLGDLVRARLDYQMAENRLGLFLDGYHLAVTEGDGRVRPTVYTLEAKSGRMSCVRPNLQQVPREGGFRACITADPGHMLISADFSSVELRVAAALSGDLELAAIQADPDRDLHREIAQLVWGPNATKEHRYQAKRKVFGRIYGSGINGLVTSDPPVSEPIARAIVDALGHVTPTLTAWSRSVADGIEAGRTQFRTYSGRVVHMPVDRSYAGPNYCIQGTARELLVDALDRWSRTRWGDAVLLPVHDEVLAMVPEDEAEEATQALVECMTTELMGVPIVVEADEPSRFWRDAA